MTVNCYGSIINIKESPCHSVDAKVPTDPAVNCVGEDNYSYIVGSEILSISFDKAEWDLASDEAVCAFTADDYELL